MMFWQKVFTCDADILSASTYSAGKMPAPQYRYPHKSYLITLFAETSINEIIVAQIFMLQLLLTSEMRTIYESDNIIILFKSINIKP